MIGVIVLPGRREAMHGLDEHAPLSLLPLGDRPMLQHMVEFLAHNGVSRIELILEHAPERVEALLGNGARWGCDIRYHLAQSEAPYKPLRVIAALRTEPCVLLSGDALPLVPLPQYAGASRLVLFEKPAHAGWNGSGVFPAGTLTEAITSRTATELALVFEKQALHGDVDIVPVADWADASTPADLLATQALLLKRQLRDSVIEGIEGEPGVWISRNVVLHPSVKIHAPVYIGPNCRVNREVSIGPNVVLSGNCIVDARSAIHDSLLTSGTYVGQNLEVQDAIIHRNLLVNAKLQVGLTISEDFLFGGLAFPSVHRWPRRLLQSAVAALLVVLLFPFYVLSGLVWLFRGGRMQTLTAVRIPTLSGPRDWHGWKLPFIAARPGKPVRSAGWSAFLWTFLPGLPSVAMGRLSLVGLTPRRAEEIEALPLDWRLLYLRGKAGLITEASTVLAEDADESEVYVAEACYAAMQSWRHDLKLARRYFMRLVTPSWRSGFSASTAQDQGR